MLRDYDIRQEIVRDPWTVWLRAERLRDRQPVLVKATAADAPAPADADAYEREIALLRRLEIAGVARPLELLRDGAHRALVLADDGLVPLRVTAAGHRGNTAWALAIAADLLAVVAALHRQDVIHGGLSPWNVHTTGNNGVRLVDLSAAGSTSMPPAPLALTRRAASALPYTSPEQTGRMNRGIDHRTDLYSIGVILFELLTGAAPFVSDDPLELVHWHIARTPPAPAGIDPRVDEALAAVIARLLAKTPEERYQSADGARADVAACLGALQAGTVLAGFVPGRTDASDRFMVSERLYGRDRELRQLVAVFDGIRAGGSGLALISGASGAGKTVLIQELYKPLVRERGSFTSGKFDLAARDVPFGGLIQAFSGLLRQLLAGPEDELSVLRDRVRAALGPGASVLAGVIPEVELLVGSPPPAPPLDGVEALNRFQMAFVNFLGALAGPGQPLVVFLDDLQWADAATLNLLGPLLTSPAVSHLLIVGAYRDTEVDAESPLTQALNGLEAAGVKSSRITLAPLRVQDIEALLADTLRQSRGDVAPLARLVHATTAGSPFFVIQFLKTLHRDRLLQFDAATGSWQFNIEAVADAATTEDVVELMTSRIQRLNPRTQRTLTFAALLGGRFRASTVAVASESELPDTEDDLRGAVAEGLVVMAGDTFRFLHDRVQQAAMGLLLPTDRGVTHAAIGRRLLAQWDRTAAPEQVFEVVGHLNRGIPFHGEVDERLAIARLNLEAGRRAKASTAWEAAAGYFDHGIAALAKEAWTLDVDLAFALHLEAADCHYLARHFDTAESYTEEALAHAPSPVDAAQLHALRMVVHENLSLYDTAVASGRLALALLGVQVPEDAAAAAALDAEIQAIESLRAGRAIASLVELPAMSDPSTQTAMRILTSLWSPAYISGRQIVARWISATLVRLSLTLGNTGDSAYGYVTHAITIGPERGDYESAYEWGRLALAVNSRFDDRKRRAKVYQQFHAHVCLWRRPFAECVGHAREATRSGLESGDLNYAGYGAVTETWAALPIANDLGQFVRDYEPAVGLVERLHLDDFRSALRVMLGLALALQGRTASLTSLTHSHFDEASYLRKFGGEVFFRTFYYTAKLQLCVLAGDVAGAQVALGELDRGTLAGTIWPVLADFWGGLALASGFPEAPPDEQARRWARLSRSRDSLRVLAENAPENYRVFWLLLSAEMARASLQLEDAVQLAANAAAYAANIGNLQLRAFALETGAKAVAAHAGVQSAQPLIVDAVRCYEAWGARAKAAQVRAAYPSLLASRRADGAGTEDAQATGQGNTDPELSLDVATVLKISQAIAVEIRLADLLPKLMRIAIESAGAQRGLFIQESKGRLVIEAEWSVGMDAVRALEAIPIDDGTRVATSVIRYVRNTSMSVVVSDALRDDRFAGDSYVQAMRPRSILSVPVVHQGRVSGILYLEHRLAPNVFTNERVSLMQLVSAQAAIALENAGLYREVTDEAVQRRRAEEMLREVTEGTATALGEGFFRSLVQHLASALRVRYAFVTECREARTRARSLAFWNGDRIVDNFEYDVADTPCKGVFDGGVCYYPHNVQNAFPKDLDLVSLKAESYLGAPMVDAAGQVIGHIAVLDEQPMGDDTWAASVLSIFSARAGAELERLHAERELRAALVEVENLKNRLQAENVYLQDEIRGEHNFEDMVGSSPALLDVLRKVERVAATDATVLILGETGTGKELIARALHSRSSRKHRPLVKVNCGAITAGLVESELFGHVKGAFTGAIDKRIGRFELADGGTIFLDEVGELPLESQVKLLRVLQEQEFEPVGSSRTVRVNVRIIAATNRNLEEAIAGGRFRADLYFRLNVLSLTLPPLRERQPDIPLLVTFYVARFARQFGKRIDAVSQDTMRLLSNYAWPGNVRELQNVVERAVVLSDGPVLSLGADLLPRTASSADAAFASTDAGGSRHSGLALEDIERRHIESVLRKVNYVIEGPAGAAQVLSLHPNTLRSRMKKLGISRPAARPAPRPAS